MCWSVILLKHNTIRHWCSGIFSEVWKQIGKIVVSINFCFLIHKMQLTFTSRANSSGYDNIRCKLLSPIDQSTGVKLSLVTSCLDKIVLMIHWWIQVNVLYL